MARPTEEKKLGMNGVGRGVGTRLGGRQSNAPGKQVCKKIQ